MFTKTFMLSKPFFVMFTAIGDIVNNLINHWFNPINKLPKSYRFQWDKTRGKYEIRLNGDKQFVLHCRKNLDKFKAFFVPSTSGNRIACLMIRLFENPKYTIVFNHGSTVDLGNLANFLVTLGQKLCCNVFVYDYSGYGQSAGTSTEKACYADAEVALAALMQKYDIAPEKIVLYGQSMGTAVALHLASNNPVKAVILHSPFLSCAIQYFPKLHTLDKKCRFYDFFKNIEMIDKTKAPMLIMHGINDQWVKIWHAKELHKRALNPVEPLWVEGGGHDDLHAFDVYMKRLKQFIDCDLEPNKYEK